MILKDFRRVLPEHLNKQHHTRMCVAKLANDRFCSSLRAWGEFCVPYIFRAFFESISLQEFKKRNQNLSLTIFGTDVRAYNVLV
jgi:hypothetical protein